MFGQLDVFASAARRRLPADGALRTARSATLLWRSITRAPLAAAAEVVMAQQSLRKPAQLMVQTVTINPAKQSTLNEQRTS